MEAIIDFESITESPVYILSPINTTQPLTKCICKFGIIKFKLSFSHFVDDECRPLQSIIKSPYISIDDEPIFSLHGYLTPLTIFND